MSGRFPWRIAAVVKCNGRCTGSHCRGYCFTIGDTLVPFGASGASHLTWLNSPLLPRSREHGLCEGVARIDGHLF